MSSEREDLIHRITQTQRGLGRLFAQQPNPLFSSNLTMRQLHVVMLLAINGSASGQELAHHLGVGLGTVTGLVDRLVAHGLVTRHEDPHDRRVRRAELSPAGAALVEEINTAGLEHYRRILDHLDTEMLRSLEEITRAIRAVADKLSGEADKPSGE